MRTFVFVFVLLAAGCGTRLLGGGTVDITPPGGSSAAAGRRSASRELQVRPNPSTLPAQRAPALVGVALDYASIPVIAPARRCAPATARSACLTPGPIEITRRRVVPTCGVGERPRDYDAWFLAGELRDRTAVHVGTVGLPFSGLRSGPYEESGGTLDTFASPFPTPAEWLSESPTGASSTIRVRRTMGALEFARWTRSRTC